MGFEDNENKAYFKPEEVTGKPNDNIYFMFNPAQINLTRANEWTQRKKGPGVDQAIYSGANAGTMGLDLFLDSTDSGQPVTKITDQLLELMEEVVEQGKDDKGDTQLARPRWVEFHWGTSISFRAVIASISLNFTYFSAKGVPLRASAKVNLRQFNQEGRFGKQNPTSGTPNPHKVHRVLPGETLDRIAAHRYKDATKWRAIAMANGVEDPLAIRPGTLLSIPRLEP
ncbi:MAG: LysM peptidoglycan-binding protein [Acidimicrobiales bacterium]|nr:LysM peptidoglycan-binding protein [Acidimicrobiales bacterium]